MKKIKILAILFLSCAFQNSNADFVNITGNNLNKYIQVFEKNKYQIGLTDVDITKYLTDRGYTVISTPVVSGATRICHTTKNNNRYFTTVFTDGSKIIAHEDVRL